jgi:hypothetical protein
MTPIAHLHTETKVMMVKNYLDLLSSQFLARALRESHPSHSVVTIPQGAQQMKETLYSKCIGRVEKHLRDGVMLEGNYKQKISQIHSAAVAKKLCYNGPIEVLGRYPPSASVHPSEEKLSRPLRYALHQLHSGKCHLQTYLH